MLTRFDVTVAIYDTLFPTASQLIETTPCPSISYHLPKKLLDAPETVLLHSRRRQYIAVLRTVGGVGE